jgi:GAF domain-containing protein
MTNDYSATLTAIREALPTERTARTRLQRAMSIINGRHPKCEWVGIYLLRGDTLELGPYVGEVTEHTRIPIGRGVCGTAVAERRNQLIEDVLKLDNYLACSATVRSEIVVLIWHEGGIVGQIDADCDQLGAFGPEDEAFLTEVASLLAPLVREWGQEHPLDVEM